MSLIPLEDALKTVEAGIKTLGVEQVSLSQALGRVLASDVAARLTQPPAPVSSMDGYAVRASDVGQIGTTLTLIGQSQAGGPFDGTLGNGQCVRIFTGAQMPQGADAVIIQEDTVVNGAEITFNEVAFPGKFVREKGLDFNEGDILLSRGQILSTRHVALLASMNVPWVKVFRRPRVAILATGDELVMPGEIRRSDQIISSNSLAIASMVTALGGEPISLGIAGDSENALREMIASVDTCDLLVTSGGVSVGEYDLVRQVLGQEGLQIGAYRIAMKPGKPFMFGHIKDRPVMGLPGNPVSAFVTAYVFLRPALRKMMGLSFEQRQKETAICTVDLKENGSRQEFMRARFSVNEAGQFCATPYDQQDSSMLANLANCDGFIIRPVGATALDAGQSVEILKLNDGIVSL